MLEKEGISHHFKDSANSLAVVDAAIRTLKVMIASPTAESSSSPPASATLRSFVISLGV